MSATAGPECREELLWDYGDAFGFECLEYMPGYVLYCKVWTAENA